MNSMKKIIVFFIIALFMPPMFAQVRNGVVTKAKIRPKSVEEWAAPLREAAEQHQKALASIQELKQYINDILGENIDNTLREELNDEYDYIDYTEELLEEYGISQTIMSRIRSSQRNVQKAIRNYNNRVAIAQKEYEKEQKRIKAEAEMLAAQPQEWSGTGFALNNGYVVTNYHVVEDAKSITISGINGDFNSSCTASVVATDKINDLAIIRVSDSRFNGFGTLPYAIDLNQAEVGDDVFVLGYPLTQTMGDEIKLTNGIISSRTGFQGDVSLYQMSAPIQPGNSGGPMFNSKGNVVGIVCAHHKGTENVGYAIKTSYLKNLAKSSSLSNIFPTNNTVASQPLSGQVKKLKKYVYLIKCSSRSNSTTSSTATTTSNRNKTIYYPSVLRTDAKDLTITKVSITDSYTAIQIRSKFTNYPWCCIYADTYITANGRQYKLTRTDGINISPQVTFYNNKDVTFTLYFPPIPSTTTQIDLIEPGTSSWKLYGIKLQ